MPQLNPNPWFMILMYSWLVLLVVVSTKVSNITSPNELILISTEKHKTESWNWPW
uniref:ATP synthase complex subunit 8 n=1 Tax=Enteromius trimaculatus TaxID=1913189 RepID=A0ZRE7_9TELE|nr:ATP synthase F0 subunit 8 [Enteromius trimaculatus]BAF41627.1 ATPase subunit 8 [Enteromius trimaculatus]